jgi:hypothetical protein
MQIRLRVEFGMSTVCPPWNTVASRGSSVVLEPSGVANSMTLPAPIMKVSRAACRNRMSDE